jgi:IS1 family transposase
MANVLPMETRVRIAAALVEGTAVRAVERITGVSKSTILRFGVQLGEGCVRLHDRLVRDVAAYEIQCDEQHSFISKKEGHLDGNEPAEWGDVWTYVALDSVTKLVLAFKVGKRDQETMDLFVADLRARLVVVPQVASDALNLYAPAFKTAFGSGGIDYGHVVKHYDRKPSKGDEHNERFPLPEQAFITKTAIFGSPNMKTLSTSHLERFNLTSRHTVGRKRRRCLAFSKTTKGHAAAVALSFAAYNFCKVHGTLRCSPAMEAGVTDRLWSIEELIREALSTEPAAPMVAKPLALRPAKPGEATAPARQLPGGGWLRLVQGGGAAPAGTPPEPPAGPFAGAEPDDDDFDVLDGLIKRSAEADAAAAKEASVQLDLLSWTPSVKPAAPRRAPVQLDLFGIEIEPPPRGGRS